MRLFSIIFFVSFVSLSGFTQNPQILWWFDTDDSAFGQTAMADITNDGYMNMVFGCYRNDSMIYALNANDGSLLWKYNTSGWQEGCNDAAALIYDIDGNGVNDVIVPSSCNPYVYCFDGPTGAVKWETYANGRGSDSPAVIGDIDGNGELEIIFGQMGGWVMSLNAEDGSINWELLVDPNSWIQTAPTLVDLTGNGKLDFVVATWNFYDENKVYAFKGDDRSLLWSVDIDDVVYHGTAVADLTGDGIPELVIGDYSGNLYCIKGDNGDVIWTYFAPYYIGSPAVIGDLNGDGNCEIVFTSYFRVYALKSDGTYFWTYDIPAFGQAFRGAALADVNGDLLPEVIFGTSKGLVIALKGTDGSEIWTVDLAEHYGDDLAIDHAPVVGDFNNNGMLDVFVVGGKTVYPEFENNYGRAYAIQVGEGTGPDWPMFQNNIRRTGSLCDDIPTKTSNVRDASEIHIFPNPVKSNETIHINLPNYSENSVIKIFDITGKVLHQQNIDNYVIQIQLNHDPGIYFAVIDNGDGVSNPVKIVIY